jgi:hypothetical protein
MPIKLANNATSTIVTGINASDVGVVLATGDGAKFPTLAAGEYFYITFESSGGTYEIAKATARAGDSLTIVRAQEGTTAQSFAAGSRVELRVTAQGVEDLVDDYDDALRADLAASGGAALIGNTPAGTIAATTVQSALNEIVSDLAASSGTSLVGHIQSGSGATARTVQAKLRDTVSVKDFGAVGDGVADDTTAIQNAVNAVAAAGGGAVYFPAGTYNGSVLIDSVNNITLYGDGKGVSTIYRPVQGADDASVINIKGKTATVSNILIKDLTVKSSTITGTYYDAFGIAFNRDTTECTYLGYNISVINCEVTTTRSAGIVLRNVINCYIGNCYVHDVGRDGIQISAQNGVIENCYVEHTLDDCIAVHGPINSTAYTPSYKVTNNFCGYQTVGRGITSAGGRDTVISGNTIRGWCSSGITIVHDVGYTEGDYTPVRFIVANNHILEKSTATGSQGAISIQSPQSDFVFPAPDWVDYPSRTLLSTTTYPASHIKIIGNYIGSSEYTGKTVDGDTYYAPDYGYRNSAGGAYETIQIQSNSFYGLTYGMQESQFIAAEYGQSKTQILNNDFRFCDTSISLVGGAPSGATYINDIFVSGNYFDGTNSPAPNVGIVANGVRKLMITNNSFLTVTTPLSSSSSSILANGNAFETATAFGTNQFNYDNGTNAWTVVP